MKKEDVKLEYDTLAALDWAEIQRVVGSAAPATAKALFQDVSKKLKAKEVKKPYAKVGLVAGSMYLRFKDGSSHLGDTLLVKNWNPPANAPVDKASQKIADDFIESRKEMQTAVEQGKMLIKAYSEQVAVLRGNIESVLKGAQKDAQSGKSTEDAIVEASKLAAAAGRLATQAHDQMDRRVFPIFDRNRTITKPDGIDEKLIEGWGKTFYLTVGTQFTKATEYLKTVDNDLEQIQQVKLAVDRISLGGQAPQHSKLDELKRVAAEVDTELAGMQGALSLTKAIDNLGSSIRDRDTENVKRAFAEGNDKLAQANADTATVKVQKAAANYKMMEKHFDRLTTLASAGTKLGKELGGSTEAKGVLQGIAVAVKTAKVFASQQEGYLKDGLTAFAAIKKLLSAKGQKAA